LLGDPGKMGRVDARPHVVGVIMAGGTGERMRRSGESVPKPMVTVLGCPLVERNLFALLRAGVTEVVVVVSATGVAAELVTEWANGRGRLLAGAVGGRLDVVVESSPMGNAGALTLVGPPGSTLVLVFADNLTSLDLAGLVSAHVVASVDLTLAVHDETFRLPYGVVEQDDGVVTGYREKPSLPVTVGSGIAVVGPRALAALAGGSLPAGMVDLVQGVVDAGLAVRAIAHHAVWVDVNDAETRKRAEALVRADPDAFELCWPDSVVRTVLRGSSEVRVRIDDVDAAGRPCRIELPEKPGVDALDAIDALEARADARVHAWLA
jgi:NDP-sugar pyrophosphorylase family protein